jgi:hypothetical protein
MTLSRRVRVHHLQWWTVKKRQMHCPKNTGITYCDCIACDARCSIYVKAWVSLPYLSTAFPADMFTKIPRLNHNVWHLCFKQLLQHTSTYYYRFLCNLALCWGKLVTCNTADWLLGYFYKSIEYYYILSFYYYILYCSITLWLLPHDYIITTPNYHFKYCYRHLLLY